jgi:PAS domain S-box-containing protein
LKKQIIGGNTLRKKAEAQLYQCPSIGAVLSPDELLHELQVHQIELEMQNNELQNAHAALWESHNRYIDLYDFAPVSYFTLTHKGLISDVNLTATVLFKVNRGDLLHQQFAALVAPNDAERWYLFCVGIKKTTNQQNIELMMKCADGSEFPALLNCLSIISADKSPILRVTLTDITEITQMKADLVAANKLSIERKQIEEWLQSRESEFRTLAENSPEIIVRYDLDCRCIYVNPAYSYQTGITQETALHKTPCEVWNQLIPCEEYMNRLMRVMKTGKPDRILLEWHEPVSKVSKVSHDMHAVAEYNEEGQVISVLVIGHNITELKATERNLEESRAQLRALTTKREEAREEERKRIAREIHDELGQLLSVLRLNVTTLDFRFGDVNPDLRDKAQKMVSTLDRAILMIRNLVIRLRPAVLNMGIIAALEWLVQVYFESTHINCRLHIHTDNISLDEDRAIVVFRIVQESLTNVLRHSGADRVDITLSNDGGIYEVEVCDNGTGFDPACADRRNSYGIVGMRERALLLNGTLDISAAEAHGTVVKLYIPIAEPMQQRDSDKNK